MSLETPQAGDKIDKWLLVSKLGSGGSAVVWKAISDDQEEVALKVLQTTSQRSPAFKRFRDEISTLVRFKDTKGILPYLDYSLPLDSKKRAWLAMPIAKSLDKLYKQWLIEESVEVTHSIAKVLSELSRHGVSHRDLKPNNLFLYNGEWCVGDFGLVSYPGKAHITPASKKLGPQNFLPLEMLNNPRDADGLPADVYSLSKTLWVFVSRENFPPGGVIYASDSTISLRRYSSHPRVLQLDSLIQTATLSDPKERITMSEFAEQLAAWLTPPSVATVKGISPETETRAKLASMLVEREKAENIAKMDLFSQMVGLFTPTLVEINEKYTTTTGFGSARGEDSRQMLGSPRTDGDLGTPIRSHSSEVTLNPGIPGRSNLYLQTRFEIELYADGKIRLAAGHLIRNDPSDTIFISRETRFTRIGTPQCDAYVNELINVINESVNEALDQFVGLISK